MCVHSILNNFRFRYFIKFYKICLDICFLLWTTDSSSYSLFFSFKVSFRKHLRLIGQQGKGKGYFLIPPISRAITAWSSPFHIASNRTPTGNLWCLRVEVDKVTYIVLVVKVALFTIMAIMFWDFLVFDEIFFSPAVKQSVIISNKHGIHELSHELPKNLRI